MQPQPGPNIPTPTPGVGAPLTNSIITEKPTETKDTKISTGPTSNRDLFLPPPSIVAARRRKDNDMGPSNQLIRNEPQLIKPDQGFTTTNKTDENSEKPVLKGIVGTSSSQVVIVRYQNKSYLLKLGEILPGTKYRVAEIHNSSVVFLTPTGRLKLDKKERAK